MGPLPFNVFVKDRLEFLRSAPILEHWYVQKARLLLFQIRNAEKFRIMVDYMAHFAGAVYVHKSTTGLEILGLPSRTPDREY